MAVEFLTLVDVLELHADQIRRYGGSPEVRDYGLLESALAQPAARFGGVSLHADVYEMAAAYLFHLVQNHAFVDGNKRIGVVAALVFLRLNDIHIDAPPGTLYDLTIAVATGQADKDQISHCFRIYAR